MRALLLREVEVNLSGCTGLFRVDSDSHGVVMGRAASARLEAGSEDSVGWQVRGILVRMEGRLPLLVGMPSLHVHDVVERDIDLVVRIRSRRRAERIPGQGGISTM